MRRKLPSNRQRNFTHRIVLLEAALLIVFAIGCGGNRLSWVPHCQTFDELADSEAIAEQWVEIADMPKHPYADFLDYVDHLHSRCVATNEARRD